MTRTITTEAELDALPPGSVLLDRHGYPWRKGSGSWVCTSDGGVVEPIKVAPLIVLHIPGWSAPHSKPSRDAFAHAIRLAHCDLHPGSWKRRELRTNIYEGMADAVLALLPGRTEAEVKGEALREAADFLRGDMDEPHGYRAGARLDLRATEVERSHV